MDLKKVIKEIAIFAGCEAAFCILMDVVMAFAYRFDLGVLLGSIAGCLVAIGYFATLVICINIATEKAKAQDVDGGQKLLRLSYSMRMLGVFGILTLCALTKIFNILALVIPMLFVQPAMAIAKTLQKKGSVSYEH